MNRKYQLYLLLTLCVFLAPYWIAAQNKSSRILISAVVADPAGQVLEGVSILDEEGRTLAVTDPRGHFSCEVPAAAALQIEHKGRRLQVAAREVSSRIVLTEDGVLTGEKDEIPIPFGTVKKREAVGAISALDPSDFLMYDNVRTMSAALNGRVAGMLGANNIRGIGTPLFLVDGLPRDIADINIEEIDKITVLKDANASILYGTQAANGIVQVTTKRGEAGRKQLNIIAETGMATPVALPQYLGSADYMRYRNQAAINDGLTAPFTPETIDQYASGVNPYRYPDVNLYSNEFLKEYLRQNKVVAEFSGGNKVTRYYANMGWINRGSLFKIGDAADAGSNRFNVRSNIDIDVTSFIKAYIGVAMVFNVDKSPTGNFWNAASTLQPYRYAQLLPTDLMTHNLEISDGSSLANTFGINGRYLLGGTTLYTDNIYGNQSFGNYSTNIDRNLQYTQGVAIDLNRFVKGLRFNAAVSFDIYNSFVQGVSNSYAVYEPTWTDDDSISALTKVGADLRSGTQTANGSYFQRRTNVFTSFDYQRDLGGQHFLSATLLGYIGQTRREDLLIPEKEAHLGLRVAYNYAGKYLADFSSAYVNGYKLAPGQRGGYAPSLGIAWVMSEEDFLSGSEQIDFLKLRATAGIIQFEPSVNNYKLYAPTFGGYNGSFSWDDGVRSLQTRTLNRAGNDQLGFQRSTNFNVGLEGYFFGERLVLDANAFLTKRTGLIVQRSTYPAYLASNVPYENFDANDFKGFEAGLIWKIGKKNLGLDIGVNMLYASSQRVKVDEQQPQGYLNRQGRPTDAMFGLEAVGLFDSWETIENSPEQAFSAVQPGDIRYKDQNGDGIVNEEDLIYIGNSQPRMSYGLSLLAHVKSFSLFALGTARQGGYSYYNDNYHWIQGEDRYSEEVLKSWTQQTQATATYPRLSYGNNSNNYRNSTFWLYKNDFFRLERVQLSYDLPTTLSNRMYADYISLFLRGENLLRLSKDAQKRQLVIGGEPNYRSFLLGLKVNF